MKTFLATLLVALLAGSSALAQTPQKIAVIDLKKVFDGFYKTQIADAQIKEEADVIRKDLKALADTRVKLIDEYKKAVEDANNQAISLEEREKRKKASEGKLIEVNDVEQQIKSFERTADANLGEKQTRAREKILKEIQAVVNAKAKAGGYTMVLDSAGEAASRTLVVFYHNGQDDLTPAVLKDLNANAPADLPKTDKGGANGVKEEKK